MECFKAVKVHPQTKTLLPTEDSSDSENDEALLTASVSMIDLDGGACGGGHSSSGTDSFREQGFSWDEFIEEFDCQIEDQVGQKSSLYMLDGEPLKKNSIGNGLHLITDEVMKTYGLEFLNLVADAVVDTFVDRKMKLPTIIDQLQNLDYMKCSSEKKILIWIDDEPLNSDANLCFGRLLITELLSRNIEPQLVIPCNDMDEEVLYTIVQTLTDLPTPTDEDKAKALEGVFKIGLSLALATNNCNVIVIDADRAFYDVPAFHNFMDFAQDLGHQVLYLRNNPEITDKNSIVEGFANKVQTLHKPLNSSHNNAKLDEEIGDDLTSSINTTDILDSTLSFLKSKYLPSTSASGGSTKESLEKSPQEQLKEMEERLKHTEIIHKLSRAHFTLPEDFPEQSNLEEDSDSDLEYEVNNNYLDILNEKL